MEYNGLSDRVRDSGFNRYISWIPGILFGAHFEPWSLPRGWRHWGAHGADSCPFGVC